MDGRVVSIITESFWPILKAGFQYTIPLTLISFALGTFIAVIVAVIRISKVKGLDLICRFYVWVIRGTPLLVQLFVVFFGLPRVGIIIKPIPAGILVFSLSVGAYSSEIFRAAIQSIPKGQWEASSSLGMSYIQTLRRIILPQAVKIAIPPLFNSFIALVKDTSLASTITVTEMFLVTQRITARTYEPLIMYLEVLCWYLHEAGRFNEYVLLYRKKRGASQHIIDLVDGLEETYYIADVLPKPKEFQNEAYYYAIKKACKSMNDEISKITEEKQEYQEYVESFAHEIKIPIGALSLTFDNTKNYTLKKETDKIFQLVEQMLYYARSENTEKDYFVKQLQLDEVIHNVILKFRHSLMERKAIINIHDIENVIYTDEKWLTFILSQIVQNAIKYFDKQENKLTIYSQDNGTNILLVIEDNGCGIKASDLSRVFEKGFTGSNRNKANATGMGLYLSKKLCDRLGLKLDIASTEKEYTRLTITFPKGTVHNFSE